MTQDEYIKLTYDGLADAQGFPRLDAALSGDRQAKLARQHLASLSPERRAFLEREWEN